MCTGKSFTESIGLALRRNERTKYNSLIVPQLTVEFSGGAFRNQHNILPSKYKWVNFFLIKIMWYLCFLNSFVDEHYNLLKSVKLNEWMSIPDPLVKGSNFNNLLRGMAQTPGRAPRPSYNFLVIVTSLLNILNIYFNK